MLTYLSLDYKDNEMAQATNFSPSPPGEILCIEAASVLPLWAAEPSVAEGRVFLYRGESLVSCQQILSY